MAGFCSLWVWHKQTDEGKVVWDPRRKDFLWTDAKAPSLTRDSRIYNQFPEWHTLLPLFLLSLSLPPTNPPSNTEELTEWQETRTGWSGKIWCQQPRTIKGVKVLPSLNCSRSVKWELKTLHFLLWAELSEGAGLHNHFLHGGLERFR